MLLASHLHLEKYVCSFLLILNLLWRRDRYELMRCDKCQNRTFCALGHFLMHDVSKHIHDPFRHQAATTGSRSLPDHIEDATRSSGNDMLTVVQLADVLPQVGASDASVTLKTFAKHF